MAYRPPYIDPDAIMLQGVHPATLDPEDLLKDCEFQFGRSGGPGGQHRNKVETGARLVHLPSELESKATERRQQQVNRSVAISRLRLRLALKVRTPTNRDRHRPSELWEARRQGTRLPVNPKHGDYPALLAEALDVIVARRWDVAGSAKILGISMSQLSRLVNHHPPAFAMMNAGRASVGLPVLRK
ncbi:MAG: peptide chain release factor-like protein [Phycisphaeraceae bacterium]|nr:peptide chain release factor-like protein [Phycisphaerae bacterium]MCP3860564.1 peptide chain release factor-like protein [Phycisphaeraceae bacterium]MCP4012916.1 peptide chain release factor-like protein [Phycisphaeraceae bacterium]MCP4068731.1 peptide chain release factor-like protein [Phycisphaeraceae bacterium]MCP4497175.1 peptide chain release factor-like protein [Phycisphaeraceae bacterium]